MSLLARWIARVAVIVVALCASTTARAQTTASRGGPFEGTLPIRASCGSPRSTWDGLRRYEGIWDRAGHAFRGLGSPGHHVEISGGLGTAIGGTAAWSPSLSAFQMPVSLRAVFANLSSPDVGGLCLTVGVDALTAGGAIGSADDHHVTAGHFGLRVGLLTRTLDDRTRLHLEVQVVLPSADSVATSPVDRQSLFQATVSATLARGVDTELLGLGPLDWGAGGTARFQYQWADAKDPTVGAWLDVQVSIGYARLATYYAPREGLVGGVRATLLFGGAFSGGTEWSLRGGGRFAMSVGSLWPSDFVLPTEIVGVVELGHTLHRGTCAPAFGHGIPLGGSVLALEGGIVTPRFFAFSSVFGSEIYGRLGLSYTYGFDVGGPSADECTREPVPGVGTHAPPP